MNALTVARSAYLAAVIVFACGLAFFSFAFVVALPQNAGAYDLIDRMLSERPLLAFVALPLFILFLVAPFYAAKWAYRGLTKALLPQKGRQNIMENEPNKFLKRSR